MEFSWNSDTKCTEKPQSFILTHLFLMFPHFQKYLNPLVRTNKLVNSVFLPPLYFKISLRDTPFHLSLISLGFYHCTMLVEFSLTCIFQHVWEKFCQIIVLTFLENALNLCIFTHVSVPHSKLQVDSFENLFSPRRKGWRKLWFALSKFNQKTWRWLEALVYLHLVWM